MKKIYKYPLKFADVQRVEMPKGAVILTVQIQCEFPFLWAEVDPRADKISRSFVTYGTGHPMIIGPPMHYIGTYQMNGGAYHVYTDQVEYPKGS